MIERTWALRAFQEAGARRAAPSWPNAPKDARNFVRRTSPGRIGAFFPERYGDDLIRVSLDILNQRQVPPAVFVEHKLVTLPQWTITIPMTGLRMIRLPVDRKYSQPQKGKM